MANNGTARYETKHEAGGSPNRPGNPLARLAARQRELESELAAARRANQQTRAKAGSRQWHVRPTPIQEDEGWFTTYLDVMTLLLVLLVVMLSFAGKNALQGFAQATGGSASTQAAPVPSLPGLPAIDLSPLSEGIGLLPASNGLLPEIGIHHQHRAPVELASSADSLAQTVELPEPVTSLPESEPSVGRIPNQPAGMDVASAPNLPDEPAPAAPQPDMLAGLPLGELGDDIDIIVNERSISFRINSEILFDSGKADLSVPGLAVLKRLIPVFDSVNHNITVEGHTDSVPMLRNRQYPSNWELSGARAGSVVRYLEANGVASKRLRAVGNADTRPLGDNSTPEGRASNRRVELVMERKEN